MAHEHDYDAAAAAKGGDLRMKVRGEWYEYPPEAPIDVAIDWMDRQTRIPEGETQGEYMLANYRTVIGHANFEKMRAAGAGSGMVDDLYRDLLDEWGLWKKPTKAQLDLDAHLTRLDVLAKLNMDKVRAAEHAVIVDDIRKIVDAAGLVIEEEPERDEADQGADNPS